MKEWREALLWGLMLLLVSWLSVRAAIFVGEKLLPRGDGYPKAGEISADLFRFDSIYYLSIAEKGYSYNGNPSSSPNIVFAPAFSLLAGTLGFLPGLDAQKAGFALNKILLWLSLAVLYVFLRAWLSRERILFVLLAMATAAGAYAFHAYYSESTMLFFLSLSLLAYQRGWWIAFGVSSAFLGASRLTAFPVVSVFAILALRQAVQKPRESKKPLTAAFLCLSGAAAYLVYIAAEFGNPFTLLDTIQKASWGRFHRDPDWISLLTGGYLVTYWKAALGKGLATCTDIKTLNLVWTSLGLLSGIYLVKAWGRHVLTYAFLPYLLFVYYSNSSSEFLISAHRFFTLMLPIFLMLSALCLWLGRKFGRAALYVTAAVFLLINLGYGLLHTGAFNQGLWFWF